MNKEQIKYAIVALVIILLAIGAFVYSKKKNMSPENQAQNTEIPLEEGDGQVSEGTTGGGNTAAAALATDISVQQFNNAMKNGQTALRKGDYKAAIASYELALKMKRSDTVYAGLYDVYLAQKDWKNARVAIDNAIKINPLYVDYWKWKLNLLDERTDMSFADLKAVYTDGLLKIDPRTKINLITHFATIAEANGEIAAAIALWEDAKKAYPQNTLIYQAEIDRLR